MNQNIIIFGSHGYNTLGTIHCMVEKGVNFQLLLVKGSRLCNVTLHSKYVKKIHVVNSEYEGVQWLITHKEELKDSVIYPTSDKAESVLDSCYDTLIPYFYFPNAGKQGAVNRLMNKEVQIKMAEETGLHILNMFKKVNGGGCPRTPLTLSFCHSERSEESEYIHFVLTDSSRCSE